jgi:hypothetical protein
LHQHRARIAAKGLPILPSEGIARLDESTQAEKQRLALRSTLWRSPAGNHSVLLCDHATHFTTENDDGHDPTKSGHHD